MKQRIKEKKEIPQDKAVSIFFNTVGILILIVEAYPLIYVLSASFSSSDAISLGKVYLWPVEFSMEGYKMLVQNSQILNGFKNSIIYMGLGVLLNMSLTMLLAFPLSRKFLINFDNAPYLTLFFFSGILLISTYSNFIFNPPNNFFQTPG